MVIWPELLIYLLFLLIISIHFENWKERFKSMILTRGTLTEYAVKRGIYDTDSTFRQVMNENKSLFSESKKNEYDVFLSHSILDKRLVLTLLDMFKDAKYTVYIDWIEDKQLSRANVSPSTADILRKRMNQSRGLAFITTQESLSSKWCPWELGYFDGKSKNARCCILPVLENSKSKFIGQEYLGLYPYLEYKDAGYLQDFYINDIEGRYVSLREWINGKEPYTHY